MAGILPEKYQAYVQGKISYDEATGASSIPAPAAPTNTISNSTPYSSGSGYNYGSSYTPSNTPAPPAITQQAKPQTNPSGQTQLPSWMGNSYSQVPGTDWYSTNPSNPNASKYRADGSPVASIGVSDDKGYKFDGYGTPEQFNQIIGASSNPQAVNSMVRGWADSGQLISNDSIYNNINKAVAAGTSKGPALAAASSQAPATNYGNASSSNQFTPDQQSAQAWINNAASGIGGMDSYIKGQQAKYDYATRSGDQEMLNNLNKDMQRVGYSLNQGAPASGGGQAQPTSTGTTNTGGAPSGSNGAMGGGGGYSPSGTGGYGAGSGGAIGTDIMNGIMQQIQAITQGLNSSQQANSTQVAQNNAQVAEQIAKMVKQKALELDNAVSFQNRRGGFYSGGIDTQKSAIDNGFQEASGNLNRDVAARNDAIWSNNSLLAKQAADKIAMLQQQAPDQIRAAVSAAAAKQHEDDIKMAGVTGYYQNTAQVDAVKQKMAQNSADYALASPTRQKELHDENMRLAASIGGVDATGNGDYTFGQGMRTIEGQKVDYNQYKDQRDFNYQAVRDSIADGKWTTETENSMKKWAEQNKLDWATLDLNTKKAWAQIAISQQNANTSEKNASVSQKRYNDQQSSRGFEGTVMDELSQLDPSDYEGWLTKNRGEIVRQLGTDGFDKIKKSVTSSTIQQGKQDDNLRKQAINLAKNDPDWSYEEKREGLIQEYMGYLK